jgi:recombination protein RecA
MRVAYSKAEIESLAHRFGAKFKLREKPLAERLPIGIPEVDRLVGGLPRGAITEILGPASSGRTTLLHSLLATSTGSQEVCALVDGSDSFDATSAAAAGVDFDRLLWVRCGSNLDHAIKATDLLLQSGGFGLVALDLGDVPSQQTRRLHLSWWFRFRRAIENSPAALLVISSDPNARSCASLVLELSKEGEQWSGAGQAHLETPTCANLLGGLKVRVDPRKPTSVDQPGTRFRARRSY